jgi:glycosyltransferase involved in cell wall biosynthesis
MPKVSVLISTYNRPNLLRLAIASALNQTMGDMEVIVRDDASTDPDEVPAVLAEFADERLVYRRNATNVGVGPTNVRLYREATGEYLAHLDDDDLFQPTFLERMVGPLEANPDVGLAFANHLVIDDLGAPQQSATSRGQAIWGRDTLVTGRQNNGRWLAAVRRAVPTSHSAVVRTRTFDAELFTEDSARAWDMHVACLAVRRTGIAWFDSDPLTCYRWGHADQMSASITAAGGQYAGLVWNLRTLANDQFFAAERRALNRRLAAEEAKWAAHLLLREHNIRGAISHGVLSGTAALRW